MYFKKEIVTNAIEFEGNITEAARLYSYVNYYWSMTTQISNELCPTLSYIEQNRVFCEVKDFLCDC